MPAEALSDLRLVEPGAVHKPLFDRMAQLYAHDFSAMEDIALGPDGNFPSHVCFSLMWTDPNRHPRLIFKGEEPAGFAIVLWAEDEAEWEMEQFFVLRKFRRQGVGRAVACALFRAFPGTWYVEQVASNIAAQQFWANVIADFTNGAWETIDGDYPAQRFVSQ